MKQKSNDPKFKDESVKSGQKPSTPRRNRKPKYSKDEYKKDSRRPGANDISWYAQDATLLRNVGNLPWSTQSGITYYNTLNWKNADASAGSTTITDTIPGFMCAYLLTGPGRTKADIDAVNISANAIYTFVRHMNSGSKNYDAPDLMAYLLAMDDVFSYINWLQRLYGTIAAYNVFNRYTPEAIIKAQGVDYADLRDNMVAFKYRINLAIKQAATLVVPNTMPLYSRHAWLYSNYYIEGTDIKDQIYFYSPVDFHQLNPTTGELFRIAGWNTTAGSYRMTIPDMTGTLEYIGAMELCDKLDQMLRVLYTNEDTGIMAGDILKAYGESNIIRLSELPDAYVTPILPNNEVLLQFKNSTSPYYLLQAYLGDVTFGNVVTDPNTNKIYWNLDTTTDTAATSDSLGALSRLNLLTLEGDPSPEMNMIMTRLMSYVEMNGGAANVPACKYYCGTEIVVSYGICTDPDPYSLFTFNTVYEHASQNDAMSAMARLSNFKYHPRTLNCASISGWRTITYVPNYYSDFQIDNFTYIQDEVLDRLNQVAIMSELNVPHMALVK